MGNIFLDGSVDGGVLIFQIFKLEGVLISGELLIRAGYYFGKYGMFFWK